MGPILVFDKSVLESLSPDEAVWLDQFFLTNITPLFFIETLADLEKEVRKGRTAEEVVGSLAYKTPDSHSSPNVHHAALLQGELSGQAIVKMGSGFSVISGGMTAALEGKSGVYIRQPPEAEALHRWQRGEFLDLERTQARMWRRGLALLDLEAQRQIFRPLLVGQKLTILSDVKALADRIIDERNPEAVLSLGLRLIGVSLPAHTAVVDRWMKEGKPPIRTFAPYFRHVLGVDLFFYLGLAASLISAERRTNKVDIAYLYYLPFCMVFTSNDRLHERVVPLFLRENQTFVPGRELKDGLAALDAHFSTLPEETRAQGTEVFATRPPEDTAFLVTRLWDAHLPAWREKPRTARAPARNRETELEETEKWRRIIRQAQVRGDAPSADSPEEPDFMIFQRQVRPEKGKWNRFPKRNDSTYPPDPPSPA